MENYAPEFYRLEHIIGYSGNLDGDAIVYFKKEHTFGSIHQCTKTTSSDAGRALVMTDSTHTWVAAVRQGVPAYVEKIGGLEFGKVKAFFTEINDSNSIALESLIQNNVQLRPSHRAYRQRALWDYAFGYLPSEIDSNTLDYHIRNAARQYIEFRKRHKDSSLNSVLEQASSLDWSWLPQDYKNYPVTKGL